MEKRLEFLKFLLQESNFEYFDAPELMILYTSYDNIYQCAYEGCLLKAQDDSVSLGILNTPTNENYWIRLAMHYKLKWEQGFDIDEEGTHIKPQTNNNGGRIVWRRADEY